LEPLDRELCAEIKYKGKTFFAAKPEIITRRYKILQFLEKLGLTGSRLYDRIDDLYVPPLEYAEIREALEKDRMVFVTGTAEYGKTYTAVRLLWEYSIKGYEPVWIKREEDIEIIRVRERFEEIETELKPHRIIYFEDPFGTTKYIKREGLERRIGTIIDSVQNVDDVYVVITAREEVFKQFQQEHLSSVQLQNFEKKLNIKKPSYNYEKRKQILLKWAKAKDCKWLGINRLRDIVLKYMKKENNMPTPLSIRDFIVSTVSVTEEDQLIAKIEEKSRETARSFAQEIENMSEDKILFLSFPFIYNFHVDFVRAEYEVLVKVLDIPGPWDFERTLNWFKDDKVDIREEKIMFSHPSYSQALDHLLVKKGDLTRINREIFSKVLLHLSAKDEKAEFIPDAIVANFDKLPEDERNETLNRLLEKRGGRFGVAVVLMLNFDKFPKKDRDELLFKISERDNIVGALAITLIRNFDTHPEEAREFLDKLPKVVGRITESH